MAATRLLEKGVRGWVPYSVDFSSFGVGSGTQSLTGLLGKLYPVISSRLIPQSWRGERAGRPPNHV